MDKILNKHIIEAISNIIENVDGDVTYSVSQREDKPVFSKTGTNKIISIDINITQKF